MKKESDGAKEGDLGGRGLKNGKKISVQSSDQFSSTQDYQFQKTSNCQFNDINIEKEWQGSGERLPDADSWRQNPVSPQPL